MSNELITIENKRPVDLFKNESITDIINSVQDIARSIVTDATTEQGRKDIKSLARKVASTKTAIDDIGKEYVAGIKAEAKVIDAERKRLRDELDALRDEIKAPVVAYENIEKERVAKINERINDIYDISMRVYCTPDEVKKALEGIDVMYDFDFQEFNKKAHDHHVNAKQVLDGKLNGLLAQEELEKQRKEQERKELEARIVKETEERVKREYESKEIKEEPKQVKTTKTSNVDNKRKVNNAILSRFVELGCPEDVAKSIIKEIATDNINNMFIVY